MILVAVFIFTAVKYTFLSSGRGKKAANKQEKDKGGKNYSVIKDR